MWQTLQCVIIVSHFFTVNFDMKEHSTSEFLPGPNYGNRSTGTCRYVGRDPSSALSRKKEYVDISDIVLVKAKGRYGKQALDRWHNTERYKSWHGLIHY